MLSLIYFRVRSWYMLIVLSLILLRYCTCIRPVSRFSFNFSLACSAMIARFTYFAMWLSSIKWSFWSLPMISLCCILSLQLGTWSWNLLCYMSLRMWHGQYSSHFMSRIFSVLYLHRKAHALCTSNSVSRNLRPVILDGNSYIDSLSNHWVHRQLPMPDFGTRSMKYLPKTVIKEQKYKSLSFEL